MAQVKIFGIKESLNQHREALSKTIHQCVLSRQPRLSSIIQLIFERLRR